MQTTTLALWQSLLITADAALPLFKTALDANPKIEQFWLSYIDALIKGKQFNNAKDVIQQTKKHGVASDNLNALMARLAPIAQTENASSTSPSQEQRSKLLNILSNWTIR